MIPIRPGKNICVRKIRIGKIPVLVLSPDEPKHNAPGVLWIHGGGYFLGMKEMVYMSRAENLVRKFGAVVISPDYRLALRAPYPAAVNDCFDTLVYMRDHASELGINIRQLMIGGESAGGGLCAALCMMARDRGIKIAYQMPLYPMLDNLDTESSKNNHGKVWNTRRNHLGWKLYLRKQSNTTNDPYAAPARQTDFAGLPPAYTFVGDGEPFYCETLRYIAQLQAAGIEAVADVYPSNMHAFDMLKPDLEISRQAVSRFEARFAYALTHYFTD